MGSRGVTKGREALAAKLTGIRGARVVLVFDGKAGEAESVIPAAGGAPEVVVTAGGDESRAGRETA